jgi:hypothetical protein
VKLFLDKAFVERDALSLEVIDALLETQYNADIDINPAV